MRKRISSKAHDNPSSQNKKKAEDEAAIVHSAEALQGSVCGRICSHIFASAQSIWPHVWAANCDNLQKNTWEFVDVRDNFRKHVMNNDSTKASQYKGALTKVRDEPKLARA